VLRQLIAKIEEYRAGATDLDDLQASLWGAAQSLTSREDRQLREQLQDAEGRLELIRFTTPSESIETRVCTFLDEVVRDVQTFIGARDPA
jgi:hypothetical protein